MVRTTRVALLTTLSSLALFASPALAQGAATAEDQAAAQDEAAAEADAQPAPDSTIVVTGTRRNDRTIADSPVPVDVIGSEAIVNSGQTETNKILNQLVPSFNFPQPSIADGSDALRPATLRGLSPDQTLVLINGKRRHVSALLNVNGTVGRGSAAVDMNLIPGLAIGRVEVLRDGAAAQYGSDAIAGVINIQLKNSSSGGRASATFGKYYTNVDNVADVIGLQLSGSGQPQLDPADNRYLLANTDGDRYAQDGRQLTMGVNVGIPMGEGGYFNVTAELRDRNRTNRAGFDLRPNYNRPAPPAFDAREAGFNRLQFRFGDPDSVDYNLFVNAGLELGGDWELYGFGSYGHRDTVSAANYRQAGALQNRDFSVLAPNQTPSAANFVSLTPDGFLPLIDTDLDDMAVTLGLRTLLAGWKADLSLGHGRNRFDYRVRNSLNTSFGPQSQRDFDAGGLFYAQDIANLDFSREFAVGGFAKPLSVALGGEYRKEHFEIRPGDNQSSATGPFFRPSITTTAAGCTTQQGVFNAGTSVCSFPGRVAPAGAQGFPGIPASSATDVGRHSWAAYVELDTDPIEGVTTTIAGRYEHFSDFGSTWNGKFAARWEPVEGFALRGSISNGFRAPSLHQQFFTTTSTNFINGVPVDIATLAVGAPAAQALGARALKPEKSLNMSFGATANPFRGFTVTADVYQIDIDDRIVLTETLGRGGTGNSDAVQIAVTNLLAASGFPQVAAARFFINGLDTRTRGFDVVAVYRARMANLGNWSLSAAYNYNKTSIKERLATLGPLATIPGLVLFGRVEGLRFTEGQPRDKVVLSADGDIGNFGITARTTRYGKVVSPGATAPLAPNAASLTAFGPDDIFLKAKWITDLELRYKAFDRLELAIGANNLFDVYPTRSPFGPRPASVGGVYPANQQYIPFSIFSPFGFNGRFVYGRVGIEF